MSGLRGGNLQNAYGTPFWTMRRGGAGMGDTVTLDPSVIGGMDPNIPVTNPGNYYPGLDPTFAGPPTWLRSIQPLVGDAFQFARLFNPVPPGTVMQSGPGGTYIARASGGQSTPGYFPSVGPQGFGWGTMLLIGGVILLVVAGGRGRG